MALNNHAYLYLLGKISQTDKKIFQSKQHLLKYKLLFSFNHALSRFIQFYIYTACQGMYKPKLRALSRLIEFYVYMRPVGQSADLRPMHLGLPYLESF